MNERKYIVTHHKGVIWKTTMINDVTSLSTAPGSGLYDSEAAWHDTPAQAFEALLSHTDFGNTRLPGARPRPDLHRLAQNSSQVYMLMFGKFCRHLETCGVSVPRARIEDVRSFFAGPLGESSPETVKRYTRLIERIYDDMRSRDIIKGNPVTNWITQRAFEPAIERPKPIKQAHFVATPPEVSQLQEWLYAHGRKAAYLSEWRVLRDTAIASLSLGAGLRCFELIVLSRSQVKYAPRAKATDMFEFNIPSRATVRTAKPHETNAEEMCAHLMELWWQMRWEGISHSDESRPKTVIPGDRVFPSDLKGSQLQRSTLYKALKAISVEAMTAGAVNERTEWMLTNGARGLRRAYVLSELAKGGNPHDISRRLGHHDKTSMRAYTGTAKTMSFS